jgi:hypothetical protein
LRVGGEQRSSSAEAIRSRTALQKREREVNAQDNDVVLLWFIFLADRVKTRLRRGVTKFSVALSTAQARNVQGRNRGVTGLLIAVTARSFHTVCLNFATLRRQRPCASGRSSGSKQISRLLRALGAPAEIFSRTAFGRVPVCGADVRERKLQDQHGGCWIGRRCSTEGRPLRSCVGSVSISRVSFASRRRPSNFAGASDLE